jgi:hypothetical protein
LVAVLLALVLVASACGDDTSAADWGGSWREVDTPEAYVLKLTPKSEGRYVVEYPRSFTVPFEARTEDGKLLVWGENTDDVVWTLTLDAAANELTAVGSQGTIHLERAE